MDHWLARDVTGRARLGGVTRAALGALMLGLATSSSPAAFASAALQISPVLLEVAAGGSVTGVTIANQDSRPAAIQVRLFRWTQADGEETLTPTEDVVASPPIAMGGGLLGYALAHSDMSWTLPARQAHFSAGAHLSLGGDSDVGALHATATVSAGE